MADPDPDPDSAIERMEAMLAGRPPKQSRDEERRKQAAIDRLLQDSVIENDDDDDSERPGDATVAILLADTDSLLEGRAPNVRSAPAAAAAAQQFGGLASEGSIVSSLGNASSPPAASAHRVGAGAAKQQSARAPAREPEDSSFDGDAFDTDVIALKAVSKTTSPARSPTQSRSPAARGATPDATRLPRQTAGPRDEKGDTSPRMQQQQPKSFDSSPRTQHQQQPKSFDTSPRMQHHQQPQHPKSTESSPRMQQKRVADAEPSPPSPPSPAAASPRVSPPRKETMSSLATMTGFLYKKGVKGLVQTGLIQGLRRRYFLIEPLNEGRLFYCTDPERPPKGHIDLRQATSIAPVDGITRAFRVEADLLCFEIVTPTRTWLLFAESDASRRAWIEVLTKYMSP